MKILAPVFCMTFLLFSCNVQNKQENKTASKNNKTIMAIFAHPDDEIVISPLLSKYAKEGVNIQLVYVTDGSKGVTAHAKIPAGEMLAKVRSEEASCVAKTLAINPPVFLNYTDGDLSLNENIFSLDDKIESLFTKHQPNVVITFGPDGEYGHSDHRIVSNIVTEVFQKEAKETLQELFYYGYPTELKDKNLIVNTNLGKWFYENWKTTQKKFLSYRIPVAESDLKLGHETASCHASQYPPDVVDDLFTIINQTNGFIYLRPWNGSSSLKDDIFE